MKAPWRPLGLRREVLILLPVSLLLLISLSTFTLLSYRNAISLLIDERRQEAEDLARLLASRLIELEPAGRLPRPAELRRWAPEARAVAILASDGTVLVETGAGGLQDALAPIASPAGSEALRRAVGVGPGATHPETVAAFIAVGAPSARRLLRVDLRAPVLAAQRRSLQILSTVLIGVNGTLALLLLLFLRHLLTPYETLLDRARQVREPEAGEEDESTFLIETFEKAVAALAETPERGEDDIGALQRMLSASLESGVLLLDRSGRVLALNPVGRRLLGVEAPETGTVAREALGAFPELAALVDETVSSGDGFQRRECSVATPAGEATLGLSAHPLRRDDGTSRGFLILFSDLTEIQRQAKESRLAESLSQLGELAAGVAHELRNSLATLRGYLTLIEGNPEEDSIADYLTEIRRETDHQKRVIEDFLTFARPGSARIEEIRLGHLISRAVADPALEEVEIRLDDGGIGEWRLRGDPQLLERALKNLLHNAAQADLEARRRKGGDDGRGVIEVSLADDDEGGAEVEIRDRGPGFPPAVRERLFQPFASGRSDGVGLGLALTHRILSLHGARIRFEDRPGGGIVASISFPADTFVT